MLDETLIKDPIAYTEKLIAFKAEIDLLVRESFLDQMQFQTARDNSFQEFMNEQTFTAMYIAQFADRELRVGLKGVTELDVDRRLSSIIDIFRCLHSRDSFMQTFTRELSNRLLNKTSVSQEAEEFMIAKLKIEVGIDATTKIEQMFRDMRHSEELQAKFFETLGSKSKEIEGVEFNIKILARAKWPKMDLIELQSIPRQLLQC